MPVYRLSDKLIFPPVEHAEDGLLAVGGDLSAERLELAYGLGIFPWYSDGDPILWHSPDPRAVLIPSSLHVPRRLDRIVRQGRFEMTFDRQFDEVIHACARAPRPDQDSTWITDDMIDAYIELHRRGTAHSCEAWLDGQLVGGIYGVCIGRAFFGESMFYEQPNASKVALVTLVRHLNLWGVSIIDCQMMTDHMQTFGAEIWTRRKFLSHVRRAVRKAPLPRPWTIAPDIAGQGSSSTTR